MLPLRERRLKAREVFADAAKSSAERGRNFPS
jgi:hypothetical protein